MQRTRDGGESSGSTNNNSNIVLEFFNTKIDELHETNLFVDVPFAEIIQSNIGFDYFLERVNSIDVIETPLTPSPFSNTPQTTTTTSTTDTKDDDAKHTLKLIPQLFGKSTQKVCFFVSGYLWGCEQKIIEILQCYVKNSTLSFCRIYISLSELAHLSAPGVTPSSFSHQSPFTYYCSQFRNLIEDDNVDFEIEFFPVVVHPIFSSPSLSAFILPSVCDYFPLSQTLSESVHGSEVKLTDLPFSQQSSTHHMIHTTHSLLSLFGIDSPDLYPIGETSKIIAKEIYQLKSSSNFILSNSKIAPFQFLTGTSFIVIDRDLDLVAPCLHSDNAMDRIYSLVPTTRLGSAQLKVNMTPLYNENVSEGTLSHLFDPQAAPILQSMVTKSLKEVLTTVRKKLVELITSLNLPLDLTTTRSSTITPLALITLLRILQKGKVSSYDEGSSRGLPYRDPPLKYLGLIQCVVALIESMQCAQHAMSEQFLGTEKILMLSIASENQSLIEHISEIMSQPIRGDPLKSRYSVKDMVTMCIVAYSLIGEKGFPWKDENQLKEEIMKNIVEFKQSIPVGWLGENLATILPLDKNSTSSLEQERTQMELRDIIEETIHRLQKIGGTRKKLEDFSSLLKEGPGGTSSYLSLIGQIVKCALDEKEIKDLQKYVAPGSIMGSLLKSAGGWGLKSWGLGTNIRPKGKPLDNQNLMIYVVGGVTFSEVKEVNEIVESYNKLNPEHNVNVILVGTGISTSNTVYNSVLCT